MKFKLVQKYRYWWPVTVHLPDPENAGKMVSQHLKILFEPVGRDEAMTAQEAYEKLETPRARAEHEHAQLLAVVKDWDDVEDAEKKQIPFSEEFFTAACAQPWFRAAVYNAYAESMNGREAQLGN
jgi:hypothetical protein